MQSYTTFTGYIMIGGLVPQSAWDGLAEIGRSSTHQVELEQIIVSSKGWTQSCKVTQAMHKCQFHTLQMLNCSMSLLYQRAI